MTALILFPRVSHEVTALSENEVANTSTKDHSQEQPSIVCHCDQHEKVSIANLHHVEDRLEEVH